jgi:hypothetical protein
MDDFENTFLEDTGAVDIPSENDFIASHVLGAPSVELPAEVNLNLLDHTHNQGKTMHCTAYGLTHCLEILNTLEHNLSVLCDPIEQWANQVYISGKEQAQIMEKEGCSLQIALRALFKYGLNNKTTTIPVEKFTIEGYARIENTLADIKRWLAMGYPVYSGSGRHCYAIVGYSDTKEELIALNSYGRPNIKTKGEFRIPYSKIDTLFSKYILYDKKDLIMIFKDVSESSPFAEDIKAVRDLKLINGYGTGDDPLEKYFRPENPVTRAELAAVVNRLYKKLAPNR